MKKKRATMEAVDRSHPHPSRSSSGGAGDFFICFTARPSSSSATSSASTAKRVPSSKALMSPGRGRDPSSAPALSASLSRRLRSSGSVKGGQSPMFPSGVPLAGRKKGCAFEAAEPSSPKVTCIGQVRVKAKKKVKSTAMARSRSQRGRDCCPGRNQSWVHQLPLNICEALRGIGSEFNCFVPCGGRTGKEKGMGETRMVRSASSSSCGAVVAKWLLAVQDNEEEVKGGEKLEVGFLVREREEKVEIEEMGNRGGEKGEILVVGEKTEGGEEAAARVSVCIPPRNALLLMRCRSDPVKMAALANRFWGSPATKPQCEEEQLKEEDNEVEEEEHGSKQKIEDGEDLLVEKEEGDAVEVFGVAGELVEEEVDCKETTEEDNTLIKTTEEEQQQIEEMGIAREEFSCGSPYALQVKPQEDEAKELANGVQNQEKKEVGNKTLYLTEREEDKAKGIRGVMEERRFGTIIASRSKERGRRRWKEKDARRHSFSSELDARRHSFSSEREAKRASFCIDRGRRWSFSLEKPDLEPNDHIKSLTFSATEAFPEEEKKKDVTPEEVEEETEATGEAESDNLATGEPKHEAEAEAEKKGEAGGEWTELPDCLLMMMYEPKLSMEVSKETWVCGNDFPHWRPQHTRNRIPSKPAAGDNAAPPPPPEAAATVVLVAPRPDPAKPTAVQQKLSARPAAVAPYEPLVLTRCKSEPVRSSARLAPDACFWKDRHRPIGAAGIGF